jgi:phosphatidate cytidylyltransferase
VPSRNLALRITTAAIGLPALAGIAYAGGWTLAAGAGVIALLAAAEFTHGWLLPSLPIYRVFALLPNVAIPPLMVIGAHGETRFIVFGLVMGGLMAAAGYSRINALGPRRPYRVASWSVIYVGLLMSTVVLTRDLDNGRAWIFLGLAATFATDTGAYATGKAIGRHKLAPAISPGKSIEGAVGGFVAGAAAILAFNAVLDAHVQLSTGLAIALALSLPIAAQAGDLVESAMKRRMGVKDASGLLPGHGGFLDRLDSILFVFPVLYVLLEWKAV